MSYIVVRKMPRRILWLLLVTIIWSASCTPSVNRPPQIFADSASGWTDGFTQEILNSSDDVLTDGSPTSRDDTNVDDAAQLDVALSWDDVFDEVISAADTAQIGDITQVEDIGPDAWFDAEVQLDIGPPPPATLTVAPDPGYLEPPPKATLVRLTQGAKNISSECVWSVSPASVCKLFDWNAAAGVQKTGHGSCKVKCSRKDGTVLAVDLDASEQTVIYFAGGDAELMPGLNIPNDMRMARYKANPGTWDLQFGTLPEKRQQPILGAWKNKLYVIGGYTSGNDYELYYQPNTFPWQCPEVIEFKGGTSSGCLAVRMLDLETGVWTMETDKLPYSRDGWGMRNGKYLHIYPRSYSQGYDPKKHAMRLDMETGKFVSPFLPSWKPVKSWIGSSYSPWKDGVIAPGRYDMDTKIFYFDHANTTVTSVDLPIPCTSILQKWVGGPIPDALIATTGSNPAFYAYVWIYPGKGICTKMGIPKEDIYSDGTISKWLRFYNGKWTDATALIYDNDYSAFDAQVFHAPDGTWIVGHGQLWRLPGPNGPAIKLKPMPDYGWQNYGIALTRQ